MGFWSSFFGGKDENLNKAINQFGSIGGWATGQGQNALGKALQFQTDVVSGDQSKIARSLGPEIKSIQSQKDQALKSTAEFGNRSGGNNAKNQTIGDTARSSINDMVTKLMNSSVTSLASEGSTLLDQGMTATAKNVELSQQRIDNWRNSILGRAIGGVTDTLTSAATGGLGKIPGLRKVV